MTGGFPPGPAYFRREALRARLLSAPPPLPQGERKLVPAAVLMPIIARAEPTMLFTRRSRHLPHHAGQVSFPGGRAQSGDASLLATALRELEEETGIEADFVSVEGFLDVYETGTGYAILPVVGLLREGFALRPDASEVAGVFEVPLAFLLDPANRRQETREWQGRPRRFYAFQYETHYIWGATASLLANFAERLSVP